MKGRLGYFNSFQKDKNDKVLTNQPFLTNST